MNAAYKTFPLEISTAKVKLVSTIKDVLNAVGNGLEFTAQDYRHRLNGMADALSPLFGESLAVRIFKATNHCNADEFDVQTLRQAIDEIEGRFPNWNIVRFVDGEQSGISDAYEELMSWCGIFETDFMEDWKRNHQLYLRYSDSRYYARYAAAVKALNSMAELAGREPVSIRERVGRLALGTRKPRLVERKRA